MKLANNESLGSKMINSPFSLPGVLYSMANIIASTSTPSFSFHDSFLSALSHSCPLHLTLCPSPKSVDLPAAIKSHLITVAYHVTNGRQSNDEKCTSIKAMAFSAGYAFFLPFAFSPFQLVITPII